nr:hypothetical protein [Candidatus Sigynarchaeota archaeon]
MEKTKRFLGPLPVIEPYVTTHGGVVILNGPFPIEQAHRIARLCKAAPDLLEACNTVLPFLQDLVNRPRSSASAQRIGADAEDSLVVIQAAIDKANGQK